MRGRARPTASDWPPIRSGPIPDPAICPALTEQFSSPLRIGTLPPREHRRVMVSGTVPSLGQVEQAEVLLTIRASGAAVQLPPPKKFLMALRPAGEELEVLSVSVDQPPMRLKGPGQPDAIGIAVETDTKHRFFR